MNPLRIVFVTGMSGSGKTTAIHALEDAGFFCIDNLPPSLMSKLMEIITQSGGEVTRLALVVDARERSFLKDFPEMVEKLRHEGCGVEVLFLDSNDDTLIRRFSETRRRHPLAGDGPVNDGIKRERDLLYGIRGLSDRVVDTSDMNVHALKRVVDEFVGELHVSGRMAITIISFGFKFGLPALSDLVFDVRFMTNPYFIPKFKGLKGTDPSVSEFVVENPDADEFLGMVMKLLEFEIPRFEAEGKRYLNVAIGCTGGQHRSVAIAAEIKRRLCAGGFTATCRHRDIDRS